MAKPAANYPCGLGAMICKMWWCSSKFSNDRCSINGVAGIEDQVVKIRGSGSHVEGVGKRLHVFVLLIAVLDRKI